MLKIGIFCKRGNIRNTYMVESGFLVLPYPSHSQLFVMRKHLSPCVCTYVDVKNVYSSSLLIEYAVYTFPFLKIDIFKSEPFRFVPVHTSFEMVSTLKSCANCSN